MSEPTESSPLLGTHSPPNEIVNEEAGTTSSAYIPARENFKRPIRILTWIALIAAAVDIPLIIATCVFVRVIPSNGYNWYTADALTTLGVFVSSLLPPPLFPHST